MIVRKINEIFGYGLFFVGALKLLLLILLLTQFSTNIIAISNGGEPDLDKYLIFSSAISLLQLLLGFGSIILIECGVYMKAGIKSINNLGCEDRKATRKNIK